MKKKSRFDDISRTGDCTYAQLSFGLTSLHGMYVCVTLAADVTFPMLVGSMAFDSSIILCGLTVALRVHFCLTVTGGLPRYGSRLGSIKSHHPVFG